MNQLIIKVPTSITCCYDTLRDYLLLKGNLGSVLLKLDVKVKFLDSTSILITSLCSSGGVLKSKKALKSLQSNTKSILEKSLVDISRKSYKKLKLVGVGFKVNQLSLGSFNLLKFELGYSHSFYLRVPEDIFVRLVSPTKFIVSGKVNEVSSFCSTIRKLRPIDSYKGKGILYENEKVQLKSVNKS